MSPGCRASPTAAPGSPPACCSDESCAICSGEQGARAVDVGVHLSDQLVHAVVALHTAEPLGEFDAERLPVQVTVEVEDVGLDAPLTHLEGGVGADRDGGDAQRRGLERAAPLVE